ncbi:hypothetical protein Pst134EA_032335 [Puccinia striiformis f. sp. tritici]|uniref:uncharacterized protein n=1 Tax=Puccinia striiformis f. sp. tritici TaxID=168172 RepID=UPI002008A4BA|nr:uncharacterized protein Pst134EA_032335 [Puccinia striiformis f. sp. tritici]KAH9444321.1 hypothetical protein Pst134EA_032335 [Puccinia striiformis f. sp. tritici]
MDLDNSHSAISRHWALLPVPLKLGLGTRNLLRLLSKLTLCRFVVFRVHKNLLKLKQTISYPHLYSTRHHPRSLKKVQRKSKGKADFFPGFRMLCVYIGPQTKSLAHSIKQFFAPLILVKKYPRSLIQINLQTLSKPSDRWTNGFSTSSLEDVPVRLFDETQSVTEKAALINAASLALLDAGVGMRGCGFAVGVAIIPASVTKSNNNLDNDNSDHIVLDPNPTEESSAKSLHLIGLHFGHQFNTPSSDGLNVGHVTLCESNGNFSFDQLQTVLKYGSLATQQILEFVRRSCETVYQQHEPDQEENSNPSDPNSSAVNATNENRKKKKVKKTK